MKYDNAGREVTTLPFGEAATITGAWTFEAAPTITGADDNVGLVFINPDAGTDETQWRLRAAGPDGTIFLTTYTDAGVAGENFVRFERTGTVADEMQIDCTTLRFNGTTIASTGGLTVTRALPFVHLFESDSATDEGYWALQVEAGDLILRTRDDAGANGVSAMAWVRGTGTALSQINFGSAIGVATGATPEIVMLGDTNTGINYVGTDNIALLAGGTNMVNASVTGVAFHGLTPAARPDYTVTNPSTDRALNVTADTLAQGLAVLGTVIADLIAIGLFQ